MMTTMLKLSDKVVRGQPNKKVDNEGFNEIERQMRAFRSGKVEEEVTMAEKMRKRIMQKVMMIAGEQGDS